MAPTLTVQTLLDRHAKAAHEHQRIPSFAELGAEGKIPHIAVVTCADPRCIPENILHLNIGEVIVFRNPGGSAVNALPGILALDTLVTLSDIIIIKHTDCGATVFRDADVKEVLKERAPEQSDKVDAMEFGNITISQEDKVKEDLAYLKKSGLVRKELADKIFGFVYDLETGALKPVQ